MTNTHTKHCAKCGKPFAASPNDYTINCPEHRGRPAAAKPKARAKDPKAPAGARCTIPNCGRPAVVCVPGTDFYECEVHAPRGSF